MAKVNFSHNGSDPGFRMIKGDPPAAKRRGERWWQVAEACKETPGVWAEVPDCAPGVLHAIRAKRYQAFRDGDWEVKERPNAEGGRMTIYVRFVES